MNQVTPLAEFLTAGRLGLLLNKATDRIEIYVEPLATGERTLDGAVAIKLQATT